MERYQYYKIKKEDERYKGVRYFKVGFHDTHCVQICFNEGDRKRGNGNMIGVYLITTFFFFSNYAHAYVTPCTKKEFDSKFKTTVKILNP